jgi:hypothetical protein
MSYLRPQSTDTAKPRKLIIENKICISIHFGLPFHEVIEKNVYFLFRTLMAFRWHSLRGVWIENSVKVLILKFESNWNWYFTCILQQTFASTEMSDLMQELSLS